jgi:hypothetical protein
MNDALLCALDGPVEGSVTIVRRPGPEEPPSDVWAATQMVYGLNGLWPVTEQEIAP